MQKKSKKKKKNYEQMEQKTNSKMVVLNSTISIIITLKVNELKNN